MENYTFSKENKLLSKKQYSDVFLNSKRNVSKLFCVLSRKNELGKARVGLAISKKHLNKAHDRNKVKRLIRETFRLQAESLKGLDVVVMANRNAKLSTVENERIWQCLNLHWQQLAGQ